KTVEELRHELDERSAGSESVAELESYLATARASLQEAVDAREADRAAWETTRQELEARLEEREDSVDRAEFDAAVSKAVQEETDRARSKLDAALAEVQEFRTKIREKLVAERAAWDTTRQQLEAALAEARGELEKDTTSSGAEVEGLAGELREATAAKA